MKRDMDLIRQILLLLESDKYDGGEMKIDGYDSDAIGYHCWLALEAKLVQGTECTTYDSRFNEALLTGLTWEGHEFIDKARSDTIWAKAKKLAIEKTGSLSLEAVKIGLGVAIKAAFG